MPIYEAANLEEIVASCCNLNTEQKQQLQGLLE